MSETTAHVTHPAAGTPAPSIGVLFGFFSDTSTARTALRQLRRSVPDAPAALFRRDPDGALIPEEGQTTIRPEARAHAERWLLAGEAAVVVQAPAAMTLDAFDTLRQGRGGRPVTFYIPPRPPQMAPLFGAEETVLPAAPLPPDRLVEEAERLATQLGDGYPAGHPNAAAPASSRTLFSPRERLDICEAALNSVREALHFANRLGATLPPAGEWLLDNGFAVRAHAEDVRRNLPPRFLATLPHGQGDPLPRTYRLATALVDGADAQLETATILRFIAAFQTVQPLEMGEIWAVPLFLRLRLIEMLYQLGRGVLERHRERLLADFWASRLLTAVRRDPGRVADLTAAVKEEAQPLTPHLVDQIVGHLQDEDTALGAVRPWAEQTLGRAMPEIVADAQRTQAAEGVSVGHIFGSLRALATLDWRGAFETLSMVEATLRDDPAGVYARMDFTTRDRYRHAVEEIAGTCRPGTVTQLEVAEVARDMARLGEDDLRRHVGYWLLDRGRPALEARVGSSPTFATRARRFAEREAGLLYPSAIGLITAFVASAALSGSGALTPPLRILILLLALFPASEIAVQTVNFLVTRLFPPRSLPKMGFDVEESASEASIPDEFRTLVVVPMMLFSTDAIAAEIERLEIRYLGNPDPNLCFALLSDYADAPLQHMPEDAERLDAVVRGIEDLNRKHANGRFFLFHRERSWSETEDRWIGWERKRGKLETLNAFLCGEITPATENLLRVGDRASLAHIKFVITLDSDTQLPKGTAARLVGALAHPLNAPRLSLDGRRIDRGYTILQPRVTTSLPSSTETRFTRLFTPSAGTDPYTNAVSDVYQDLAAEGSYHGKGIYDVEAFHRVLGTRFPEAHLLSHDLLEGGHVRVGLVTDVELFDQFPRDYPSFARRNHRWIRGDWQIADWLLPRVPSHGGGRAPNPLPALTRWKIFDNLRRSLLAPMTVIFLLVSWILAPDPAAGSLLAGLMFALPVLVALLGLLSDPASFRAWRAWREFLVAPLRAGVEIALTLHQALLSVNAIYLVAERRRTKHNLLEWETAAESVRRSRDRQRLFVQRMAWIPVCALTAGVAIALLCGLPALLPALPYLLLWSASPAIVVLLSQPGSTREARSPAAALTERDRRLLRTTARQTWRFFDDFVNAQSCWLPPDNFQEFEGKGVQPRTSPTNVGLYLLSCLAANDLGYTTPVSVTERVRETLATLDRMEKYRGHLLNWYRLEDATPLSPRYVSWVDSGNLVGALWTLDHGLTGMMESPLVTNAALAGLSDVAALLRESLAPRTGGPETELTTALSRLESLCEIGDGSSGGGNATASPLRHTPIDELVRRLREARGPASTVAQLVADDPASTPVVRYWATQAAAQVTAWNDVIDRYLPWVEVLTELPETGLRSLGQEAHEWRRTTLEAAPALRALATGDINGLISLIAVRARADALQLDPEVRTWLDRLEAAERTAQWHAGEIVASIVHTTEQARALGEAMDLRFLYDVQRRAFRIGYNVDTAQGDTSYYDLLASEARLASFCAIARGDAPLEHWWSLGRPYGEAYGRRVLRSWSGTMFEYLMPPLLMRSYAGSLLDDACRAAVECQIAYGEERGIPWGVSEAAYSALDAGHVYQYYAFGVPGLGLKRGLEDGLVVAPYATALAIPYFPIESVENLRRLAASGLRGDRGFYEAIDYTRQDAPSGKRGVPVLCWMAHHQGMALLAITNALLDDIFPSRFHHDGRVRATESLLHERIPLTAPLAEGAEREAAPMLRRVEPEAPSSGRGRMDTPDTPAPRTHLLSNGNYHVMFTNAGGGYSRFTGVASAGEVEITRWRADTTRDALGSFVYLRDLDSKSVWSAAYQPVCVHPDHYHVLFTTEKAEIQRRDHEIESVTEIVVSPEDDAEIRRITLTNRSARIRRIELTSYAEVALAPHATDRAHPAFAKLFVETEAVRSDGSAVARGNGGNGNGDVAALLATRRPRSGDEARLWAVHTLCVEAGTDSEVESEGRISFETDRAAFLGRGRTARDPIVLDSAAPQRPLAGGAGAVLDPVFALRRTLVLQPGEQVRVAFVTGAAGSREDALKIAERYRDPNVALRRAFELAWNQAQLELRHLRVTQDDAQRFLHLASAVLYPQAVLRPPAELLRRNTLSQSALWKYGISGDLPIVVITVRDLLDVYVAREALLAHTFWRRRGLRCDLVILNEEATGYDQPLQDQLTRLAQADSQYTGMDQPGGVFVRPAKDIPEEDRTLLLTVARAVIVAARGPLGQQLAASSTASAPSRYIGGRRPAYLATPPERTGVSLPPLPLDEDNGVGGFARDASEYVIHLDTPVANTPAPWSNVLATEQFGALITESGGGCTWRGNSQQNRITPWSNDPVSDTVGDAIFLRDDDTGHVWTPTPLPVREATPYRTRHGHGYTTFEHTSHDIEQRMTVFVADFVSDACAAGANVPLDLVAASPDSSSAQSASTLALQDPRSPRRRSQSLPPAPASRCSACTTARAGRGSSRSRATPSGCSARSARTPRCMSSPTGTRRARCSRRATPTGRTSGRRSPFWRRACRSSAIQGTGLSSSAATAPGTSPRHCCRGRRRSRS